jgi:hypothetical protein
MAEVLNFPVRTRVLVQLGLKRAGKDGQALADIDAELRQVETAIRALSRRRISVLARYRHQLKRMCEDGAFAEEEVQP